MCGGRERASLLCPARGSKLRRRVQRRSHCMATKPIPDGYRTATPYLILKGAAEAIEFYKRAFGATELLRMADPNGRVGHAEIRIGDSVIMLADEHPEMGHRGPRSLGGSSVSIMLYLPDVDAVFERAVRPARAHSGRCRTSSTETVPG